VSENGNFLPRPLFKLTHDANDSKTAACDKIHREQREERVVDFGAFSLLSDDVETWNLDIAQVLREQQNHERRAVHASTNKTQQNACIINVLS